MSASAEVTTGVDITRSRVLAKFHPNLQYPYETVISVALACLTDQNRSRVCKKHGIPLTTYWRWQESEWWPALCEELRSEHREELEAGYLGLVFGALEEARDRIENGDEHVTKDGDVIRVKIKGLDAMKMCAIAFDKRQVLRHQPTSIKGQAGDLSGALDAFMREREAKVVSTQSAAQKDAGITGEAAQDAHVTDAAPDE